MPKIRRMTPEETKSVIVKHYDTGFSMWIKQPKHKGERCILDASLVLEKGIIKLHPPAKHPNGDYTFGTMVIDNEIMLVVIE